MKRFYALIGLIILLLCAAIQAHAVDMRFIGLMKQGATAPACTRATQQEPTDAVTYSATSTAIARFAATQWLGTKFVYGGTTGTLCSADLALKKTGSPTGTMVLHIYSDSSDSPGSSLHQCSTNLDTSTLGDTAAWVTFSCNYASMTNGTTYWLVIYKNSYDGSNYPEWMTDSTAATEHIMSDGNGTDWTNDISTTSTGTFRLYILE